MKKRDPDNFDVHKDAELEALAKAYVQAANNRKMTLTQANKVIAQIWQEDVLIPNRQAKLLKMPLIENTIQKEFRAKAERFLQQYPEFVLSTNNKDVFAERQKFTLDIICAINKMFYEESSISSDSIYKYVRDYFKQISDDPAYWNSIDIHRFTEHIFDQLYFLVFKVTGAATRGLRYTDTQYLPTYSLEHPGNYISLVRITSLADPYLKLREYDLRASKTATNVINLIWVIETFF